MRLGILFTAIIVCKMTAAQQGSYSAQLHRPDGHLIVFTFDWKNEKGSPAWYIRNGLEKIRVNNIRAAGDSFFVQMPVFESEFRFVRDHKKLSGVWIKRGALKTQALPFTATPGKARFLSHASAAANISGRWQVTFSSGKPGVTSVGEFSQQGNIIRGTFLNADGDYRYLEGVVARDTMFLSGFDGGHAYLFEAIVKDSATITDGVFYSGATARENWTAVKNSDATVSTESVAMYLKPGQERLDFSFKDLDGKKVPINSERFKNKVVIVQLMGSWCPNCMDETAFLSDYYNNNKKRGVEVIALAYEYSTDWDRSVKSLNKFRQRFNVQYPILNTEVSVLDSLRTEKTLPQVTRIKFFPSSIIIDKKGRIRKLDTGFNGPGTGAHYLTYKKEFEQTINELLKEEGGQ